ncbi:hypothetical protein [Agrococcus sp. DT81.2]|uniref:hypothetical protein n=1 Tax=Agrococcus sp. DT81.2 TaxID=3393414 RepID=UPI003CE50B62
MSNLIVSDAPVARNTDPLTSVLAGENQPAREASEREVLAILALGGGVTDSTIYRIHLTRAANKGGIPFTEQRIRTARAQLVTKQHVEAAGVVPHGSPTGRAATMWKLVTS